MNSHFHFFLAMAAATAIASCTKEKNVTTGYGTVNLQMIPSELAATRSQYMNEEQESSILNYGVIIWDEDYPERTGLHIDLYGSRSSTILPSGKDYFAVGYANYGSSLFLQLNTLDPANENYYLFNRTFSLLSPSQNSLNGGYDGITMVSTYGKHFHLNEGEDLNLTFLLERALAKVDIILDKSLLRNADINVTSVRLKNCSSVFLPFYTESGPTKDISTSYHTDGDYAVSSQLQSLNEGKVISLYTLENLQGNRTDSEYMKKYCTYIEIVAQHSLLGEIKYRCYLGKGNEGNYDVRRNCLYTVKCRPTDDAGGVSCWRTEF